MAELTNRTCLITGANTGIGKETARALAARGATVFLACRSPEKAQRTVEELTRDTGNESLTPLTIDLADLDSVRACGREFLATGVPLHCLINNAGLAGQRGLTASGFELAFGTNHLGPFLLTSVLLDRLKTAAPARIVNVASGAHYSAPGIDFDAVREPTKSLTGMAEYSVSKLANVLHAQELARRLQGTGVTTYSLHPGVIASDIWRRVPWPARALMKLRMRSPAQGASTTLFCATSPDIADDSGRYYDDSQPRQPSAVATPELAAELWSRSAQWVKTSP